VSFIHTFCGFTYPRNRLAIIRTPGQILGIAQVSNQFAFDEDFAKLVNILASMQPPAAYRSYCMGWPSRLALRTGRLSRRE
jgi:hypothetical protein